MGPDTCHTHDNTLTPTHRAHALALAHTYVYIKIKLIKDSRVLLISQSLQTLTSHADTEGKSNSRS